ncbi:MAG: HAD-IC family P-type ATPase [Candidatus Paceibacterota bacterium]|jgi:Ca2+-transporting ATPase
MAEFAKAENILDKKPYWSISPEEVSRAFDTNCESGLGEDEVEKRLQKYGKNILTKDDKGSLWRIFFTQLKSPLIVVLLAAVVVTISISHYQDALFIFIAVLVNTLLGFYQEYKAEKALSELKTYIKERVHVIRNGKEREIDADTLVPGDIVRVSQGDRISADGRLVSVNDLEIDEAILTGESFAADKSIDSVSADALLGDQKSMVFAGTLVVQGVGTYIVCATGERTELGKIADLVAAAEDEETPLQARIRLFSLKASAFLGALTIIIFVMGILAGQSYTDMFLTSVAIAVSAIPEGLPISLTVILAVGVERMARRKGVVRKLIAAETLGSTTVILTDKTGTLTMADMQLADVISLQGDSEDALLSLALTNANVVVENRETTPLMWRMSGPIMEKALVRAAGLRSIDDQKIKHEAKIEQYVPFNAADKFSVSLGDSIEGKRLVFFGAPDILVSHSTLSASEKEELVKHIEKLALEGKRVLGVATRLLDEGESVPVLSENILIDRITIRGLITFRDPIRPNVREVMQRVERAGIKTVIVTGDHRGTAEAIAREVGIPIVKGGVIEARELEKLTDKELEERLKIVRVIARVTPADKLRIAKAYQSMGEVVAMTGDGVNDAPSIKQADVGIAMGSGTEVARNVADLVLLDDNFETIVAAVDEGRQIAQNIRKVIVYLFSNVTDGFLLIGGALLAGVPLPLNPLQILWVNFFSDSFPAIAFAFEKENDGLMSKKSTLRKGLFDPAMRFLIIVIGFGSSLALLGMYFALLYFEFDQKIVHTFIFMCFGTYTLFLALPIRRLEQSIFSYSLFSNMYMVGGVIAGVALMLIAVYMPAFQALFDTVALSPLWLFSAFAFGLVNIAAVELSKLILRKKEFREKSLSQHRP